MASSNQETIAHNADQLRQLEAGFRLLRCLQLQRMQGAPNQEGSRRRERSEGRSSQVVAHAAPA
ncbi:unnamed protein product [Chrysoparadoxa australica]